MADPKKPQRQPDQPDEDVEDLDLEEEGITERVRGGRRRMVSP